MGSQLRDSLIPLEPTQHYRTAGFKEGPQLGPYYAERRQSLGQLMYFFQSAYSRTVPRTQEKDFRILAKEHDRVDSFSFDLNPTCIIAYLIKRELSARSHCLI